MSVVAGYLSFAAWRSGLDKVIDAATRFFGVVTFARAAIVMVMATMALALFTMYEQRAMLYRRVIERTAVLPEPGLQAIGDKSRTAIQAFMLKWPQVGVLSVLSLDLQQNVRRPIYRTYNSQELKRAVEAQTAAGVDGTLPIFTRANINQNNQMISLLAGEFSCSAVEDGGFASAYKDVGEHAVLSCRVPIPPAFPGATGGAKGYVAIHLTQKLTDEQLEFVKLDVMTLAMYIFNADVTAGQGIRYIPRAS